MLFKLTCLFFLYLPFQVALNPAVGIDLASARVIISFLFLGWLAEGLRRKNLFIRSDKTTFFLILFLFLEFFSVFFAKNVFWALRKELFLFSVFPLYFVISQVVDSGEKKIKLVKAMVVGGFAVALLGLFQFFSQFIFTLESVYSFWGKFVAPIFLGKTFSQTVLEYPSWLVGISGHNYFRAIGSFPDPHMYALFLGMLLPLAAGLFYLEKRRKFWGVALAVIFLADIFSFSRGAYLGILAALVFALVFSWKDFLKKHARFFWAGVVIVMLVLFLPGPISSRLVSSLDFREGSNVGRIEMWKKSLEVIQKKPLTGVGLGNYPLEVDPVASYREPIYAHNTYLDITTETGILALLCWLGILGFSLAKFLKKSSREGIYFFVALSLVIFATHSLVETGIFSVQVMPIFMAIIAL